MGLFCVNMHFRSTDDKKLLAAVNRRGISRCTILPAQNGWTSFYEEQASRQDENRIQGLASDLTKELQVAAIAFMVHDSDIACYWLFENGRLLDHFNSCPDYFGEDESEEGSGAPSGGRSDLLARFARPGFDENRLAEILASESTFAEDLIGELAKALGIDRGRALHDYRDASGGAGPGEEDDYDDDSDDGGPSAGGMGLPAINKGMLGRLTELLGGGRGTESADPRVQALVEAAAGDEVDEVNRLLDEGAAIDAEAAVQLPGGEALAGMGQMFPGGAPKFSVTALIAAVLYKHRRAAEILLRRGADPNHAQVLFGTPVHVAVGAGEVELLRLLLESGGDLHARNARGQSPLQVLAASRATIDRLAQAQAMMKKMGMKIPGVAEQVMNRKLPTEGWDACEKLLKERGAE